MELELLKAKYGVDDDAIRRVLCPLYLPITIENKSVCRTKGQKHFHVDFYVNVNDSNVEFLCPGKTGKIIPKDFVILSNCPWQELLKGRILKIENTKAYGELYVGSNKKGHLLQSIKSVNSGDFLEIDPYGIGAKLLSSLVEYSLSNLLKKHGFTILRMSEDCAKHVGPYYNFDFTVSKKGVSKRLEVKSLWGTNLEYARLIHSKSSTHLTSSCVFDAQDIFAVNLFLRTGNVNDFAFAASVSSAQSVYGLPCCANHSAYVHQNPICDVGNGVWFKDLETVWNLLQ